MIRFFCTALKYIPMKVILPLLLSAFVAVAEPIHFSFNASPSDTGGGYVLGYLVLIPVTNTASGMTNAWFDTTNLPPQCFVFCQCTNRAGVSSPITYWFNYTAWQTNKPTAPAGLGALTPGQ